jgi:hypothetical protein
MKCHEGQTNAKIDAHNMPKQLEYQNVKTTQDR